jgi:monoamine oxidase
VTVLEARDRPGGRVLTARLPGGGPEKLPHIPVDVGASVMHGCGDANQSVFRRAVEDGIRAPAVAGGAFYECTEHAKWFGSGGEALETRVVAEMHALFWLIGRCLSAASRAAQDAGGDLMAGYSAAKRYVLENTTARPKQLTDVEEAVLEKIRIRSFAYCSRMDRMALHQASVGGDSGGDAGGMAAVIGLAAKGAEEDAAGVPRELRPRNVARAAAMLRKRVARADDPLCAVASRRPSVTPDRIVVDGYTPFLIDKMVAGLDVRYACVVDQVEYRWAGGTGVDADGRKGGDGYRVRVVTKDGAQFFADHVIVTLPIGVLQTKDPRSCVRFLPELSVAKRTAVDGLGMGVHNKVVLRFRPEDVFWPPGTPQLNCVDPRFQFLNLNAYDKPGVLLAHVFGGTSFAAGYDGLDDDGVVREVLGVLRAMFYPGPAPLVRGGGVGDRAVGEAVKAVGGAVAGVVVEACGRVTSSEVAVDEAPAGGGDERTVRSGKGVGTRPGRRGARRSSARISAVAREERRPAPSIPTIHRPRCKPATFPEPIDAIVTRWDSDPFAFGSYSYLPCGADWGMINEMAVPEPRAADAPSLFFAGEHCDDLGWQCVHGACESGTQSAALILDIVNGVPRQVRTESFRGTAGVASEAGSRCCA